MTAWGWWGAGQGDLCMAGDLMSQKGQQHKYHDPNPLPVLVTNAVMRNLMVRLDEATGHPDLSLLTFQHWCLA